MPNIRTETPKTLNEYITVIENIRKSTQHTLWFRGCGKSSYSLKPHLFRKGRRHRIKDLVETEYRILTRFKQRSIPFHNASLEDDLEILFLMQHYGIPSRLLDWTENPLIALYFATMSAKRNKYSNQAAVWILDPIIWTTHATDKNILEIPSTADSEITPYKPQKKFSSMPDLPLPLYGAHNSQRIVAQRGVFVIFGSNTNSMQNQFINYRFPTECLIKVRLNSNILPDLVDSVLESGITESVVFPDLDGLASELKRIFGYG